MGRSDPSPCNPQGLLLWSPLSTVERIRSPWNRHTHTYTHTISLQQASQRQLPRIPLHCILPQAAFFLLFCNTHSPTGAPKAPCGPVEESQQEKRRNFPRRLPFYLHVLVDAAMVTATLRTLPAKCGALALRPHGAAFFGRAMAGVHRWLSFVPVRLPGRPLGPASAAEICPPDPAGAGELPGAACRCAALWHAALAVACRASCGMLR